MSLSTQFPADQKVAPAGADQDRDFYRQLEAKVAERYAGVSENISWLTRHMPPYFEITMGTETEALIRLALHLNTIKDQNILVLFSRSEKLILARCDVAGSLYESLAAVGPREVVWVRLFCDDVQVY